MRSGFICYYFVKRNILGRLTNKLKKKVKRGFKNKCY